MTCRSRRPCPRQGCGPAERARNSNPGYPGIGGERKFGIPAIGRDSCKTADTGSMPAATSPFPLGPDSDTRLYPGRRRNMLAAGRQFDLGAGEGDAGPLLFRERRSSSRVSSHSVPGNTLLISIECHSCQTVVLDRHRSFGLRHSRSAWDKSMSGAEDVTMSAWRACRLGEPSLHLPQEVRAVMGRQRRPSRCTSISASSGPAEKLS